MACSPLGSPAGSSTAVAKMLVSPLASAAATGPVTNVVVCGRPTAAATHFTERRGPSPSPSPVVMQRSLAVVRRTSDGGHNGYWASSSAYPAKTTSCSSPQSPANQVARRLNKTVGSWPSAACRQPSKYRSELPDSYALRTRRSVDVARSRSAATAVMAANAAAAAAVAAVSQTSSRSCHNASGSHSTVMGVSTSGAGGLGGCTTAGGACSSSFSDAGAPAVQPPRVQVRRMVTPAPAAAGPPVECRLFRRESSTVLLHPPQRQHPEVTVVTQEQSDHETPCREATSVHHRLTSDARQVGTAMPERRCLVATGPPAFFQPSNPISAQAVAGPGLPKQRGSFESALHGSPRPPGSRVSASDAGTVGLPPSSPPLPLRRSTLGSATPTVASFGPQVAATPCIPQPQGSGRTHQPSSPANAFRPVTTPRVPQMSAPIGGVLGPPNFGQSVFGCFFGGQDMPIPQSSTPVVGPPPVSMHLQSALSVAPPIVIATAALALPQPMVRPAPRGGQRGVVRALSFQAKPEEDSVESKIWQWLRTIPIGNGADRGWDEKVIADIVHFAHDEDMANASAEEIYRRYVEDQVEKADQA
eukprot:TRINITY_DN34124_c0_g1_i1.p1 TRINITY_DN34124_c0_g1~~TRINITY_DN34124_c0_g1_i1.p1  ORF type:complete len:629 (-),score=81.86 TRINITY_DN34124_c0_g1_i1:53-1813(-)